MKVEERIRRCRVIEKIDKNQSYAEKIGIGNRSFYRSIENPEKRMEGRMKEC